MGTILSEAQGSERLRISADTFLAAGQVGQAEPLIRQYLEYKLLQIIRKADVPVPIDFAMKDHTHMVSNCLDAIMDAVYFIDERVHSSLSHNRFKTWTRFTSPHLSATG